MRPSPHLRRAASKLSAPTKITAALAAFAVPFVTILATAPEPSTATATPTPVVSYARVIPNRASRSEIRDDLGPDPAVVAYLQVLAYLHAVARPAPRAAPVRYKPGAQGDRRACVANNENGGDYGRSKNLTHFGRYQFSRSSWADNGGNPATWGTASPTEQDQVFATAWAKGPAYRYGQWFEWDGC